MEEASIVNYCHGIFIPVNHLSGILRTQYRYQRICCLVRWSKKCRVVSHQCIPIGGDFEPDVAPVMRLVDEEDRLASHVLRQRSGIEYRCSEGSRPWRRKEQELRWLIVEHEVAMERELSHAIP